MNWKATTFVTGVTTLAGWLMNSWLWTASPATTTAPERRTTREMTEIARQAERLHRSISTITPYEPPRRNPFSFASRPAPAARPEPAPIAPEPPPAFEPAPLPPPVSLTAIASDIVDGAAQRTAFLNTPQGIVVVREGDIVADHRVQTISDDYVEMVSVADDSVRRLSVR